jgi:hypothetical protein
VAIGGVFWVAIRVLIPRNLVMISLTKSSRFDREEQRGKFNGKGLVQMNLVTALSGPERCWVVRRQQIIASQKRSFVTLGADFSTFLLIRFLTKGLSLWQSKNLRTFPTSVSTICQRISMLDPLYEARLISWWL